MSWNLSAKHLFGYVKAEVHDRNFNIIFTVEERIAGALLDASLGVALDTARYSLPEEALRRFF